MTIEEVAGKLHFTWARDNRPNRKPRAHLQATGTTAEMEEIRKTLGVGNVAPRIGTTTIFQVSKNADTWALVERLGLKVPEAPPVRVVSTPAHDIHPFERPERKERPSGTHKRKARKGKGKKKGPNRAEVLVLNALRAQGWIVRRGGVIDFNARRGERMAWIEVKNQDAKDSLDAGQKAVLRRLRHAGLEEYVVDVWPSTGRVRVWTIPGETPVPFGQVFGQ